MPQPPIVDPASIDFSQVQFDIEAIRQANKQRFEMEQLTAVVRIDIAQLLIVAYKDITQDEFWVRGHIPGRPLMPGVVMCECAAQAASFLLHHALPTRPDFIGFGGMDSVRFRGTVVPGDRFVIVGKMDGLRSRISSIRTQGFVGSKMVFEAVIYGVPV